MTTFGHLNVPDQWNQYFTKYPQGYTILESLLNWVQQVDNMVDNQNTLNTNVEGYKKQIDDFISQFGPDLQEKVQATLTDWQNSGFLDVVISEALQSQVSLLQTNTLSGKTFPTASLIKLKLGQVVKGVSIGDSITKGIIDGGNEVSYPKQLQEQLSDVYYNYNFTLLNKGVPSQRSDQILARFDDDVVANAPDFVIIMCGTNDLLQQTSLGAFETNLSTMVEKALAANIEVVLGTILPIYSALYEYTDIYNTVIKRVAGKYKVCLVDVNKDVTNTIEKQRMNPIDFLGDGVHPKYYKEYKVVADSYIKGAFYPLTDIASQTTIIPAVKNKSCITDVTLIEDDATETLGRHLTMRTNGGVITGTTIKFYVYNDCEKGTQFYILGNKVPTGGTIPYATNNTIQTTLDFFSETEIKDYEFLIQLEKGWNKIELRAENGGAGTWNGHDIEISGFGVKAYNAPIRTVTIPTPAFVGQVYVDIATKNAYIATGLTTSDWKLITA